METISNIASTATNAVASLVYGAPETKANETGGKEPVSGQTGKGTVEDPYDQGNSEAALDKNTTSTADTDIEPSREVEPTGSIQKPEDLIKAFNNEAGDSITSSTTGTDIEPSNEVEPTGSIQKPEDLIKAFNNEAGDSTTSTTTGSGSTATGITDKAGVTEKIWKPTDVDSVSPSVTDPTVAPETDIGSHGSTGSPTTGKDTLWRGVDAYKKTSPTEPTSTGSTLTEGEPAHLSSSGLTSGGPKGAIDAEPKNYSIGDLTSGKETPPKPVNDNSTSSANTTLDPNPKTGESAISPPDLSTTSPGSKPDYSADTHQPSHSGGLAGERTSHGGPRSEQLSETHARDNHSSSISPSGDDDEKSGKLSGLKDKLKNKLHIGSKDH